MRATLSTPIFTRRQLLLAAAGLAGGVVGCQADAPAAAGSKRLRLVAEARWPHRLNFQGTTIGGLSGMDYDDAKGEYLLLSDDLSDMNSARFYAVRWRASGGEGDTPQLARVLALRLRPDTDTLLWTSAQRSTSRGGTARCCEKFHCPQCSGPMPPASAAPATTSALKDSR